MSRDEYIRALRADTEAGLRLNFSTTSSTLTTPIYGPARELDLMLAAFHAESP